MTREYAIGDRIVVDVHIITGWSVYNGMEGTITNIEFLHNPPPERGYSIILDDGTYAYLVPQDFRSAIRTSTTPIREHCI